MLNSTSPAKPAKPKDSPLFPHASGRWAKKIRGKTHYFGKWDDYPAALNKYLDERDELMAGRKPRPKTEGLTIKDLVNRFLSVKKTLKEDGELAPGTFLAYYRTCELVVKTFGRTRKVEDLEASDFEALRAAGMGRGMAASSRAAEIQRVRTLFKFAYDNGLIDRPIRFGTAFKAPSPKAMQKSKAANKEARILTAEQVQAAIDGAGVFLRAMLYLGINAGFGNHDCGSLRFVALDLDNGWCNHPRPKTGVERRAKLWPETILALRAAIAARRKPRDPAYENIVFLTQCGNPWVRWAGTEGQDNGNFWRDSIQAPVKVLFRKLGINHGAGFYSLRRMTETIGGGCKDQVAVDYVMGHVSPGQGTTYRLDIEDARLEAVANHIRRWLFPGGQP